MNWYLLPLPRSSQPSTLAMASVLAARLRCGSLMFILVEWDDPQASTWISWDFMGSSMAVLMRFHWILQISLAHFWRRFLWFHGGRIGFYKLLMGFNQQSRLTNENGHSTNKNECSVWKNNALHLIVWIIRGYSVRCIIWSSIARYPQVAVYPIKWKFKKSIP
jgi:hypothetical protein